MKISQARADHRDCTSPLAVMGKHSHCTDNLFLPRTFNELRLHFTPDQGLVVLHVPNPRMVEAWVDYFEATTNARLFSFVLTLLSCCRAAKACLRRS